MKATAAMKAAGARRARALALPAAALLAAAGGAGVLLLPGADAHGMLRVPASVRNDVRPPGVYCRGDPDPVDAAGAAVSAVSVDAPHHASDLGLYSEVGDDADAAHHGHRRGARDPDAGCCGGGCLFFSQPANVDRPTLPQYARTVNVGVEGGAADFTRHRPWRSPGAAPVLGSGCGAAGGGPLRLNNGGMAPFYYEQGADALDVLPEKQPVAWTAGSEQEVAWAITANHGGGYQLRLCKLDEGAPRGGVSEECFQRTPLRFAADANGAYSRIVNTSAPHEPPVLVKRVTVSEGTTPAGSEWAVNPIPGCSWCEDSSGDDHTAEKCGMEYGEGELPPQEGSDIPSNPWLQQVVCLSECAGADFLHMNGTERPQGCTGNTQFPEPAPGASGFVGQKSVGELMIYDTVVVPEDLEPGRYLLGWRWDCEQSSQVWQSCADVQIDVAEASATASA